ncbi:MAG: sugar transferase [Thiomargarita sp.]|nr:sugar transferase [Thiomargarita sp.]
MCQRSIDLIFASVGLVLAAPIMLLIIIAIRIDSIGNVIFSQKRLGFKGKHFMMHKFRKFPSDWGNAGPGVTVAGDARMTSVGQFLERTKLDELPQLWNILLGEMSFVGPRPESLRYADLFQGKFSLILNYVPGIFGPNQIAFRNESELYPSDQDPEEFYRNVLFPQKAERDLEYFANNNCLSNLSLIFRGIWVSLIGSVNWQRIIELYSVIILLDIILIELAWGTSSLLRFGFHFEKINLPVLTTGIWLFPLILIPSMIISGIYRHPVRYFSIHDVGRLIKTVSFLWLLSYLVMFYFYRNSSFVLAPLTLILLLFFMIMIRILYREHYLKSKKNNHFHATKINLLVYGANRHCVPLLSLLELRFPKVQIVGFIDDKKIIRGRFISKYKIIGCERDLDTLYKLHNFEHIWVTFIPSKDKQERLENWCKQNNVNLTIIFSMAPFTYLH